MNKSENKKTQQRDLVDEKGKITAFDHLLIIDKETGSVLLNRRETKGGKTYLTK